jgi:hypothetical protein
MSYTATIEINNAMEKHLVSSLVENTSSAVAELSRKYGFDVNEALRHLRISEMTVTRSSQNPKKRRAKPNTNNPTVVLPYCGVLNEACCRSIRLNHGLMTQCMMSRKGENDYCSTCEIQAGKNVSGMPTYGRIEGRDAADWRTPSGKQPVSYGNVMEKLNISREIATREAAKLGLTIPEEQFSKREAQRGRPSKKKGAITSDTESEDGKPKEKKKRGRPKKDKKVISGSSGSGDDLIASLMQAAAIAPPAAKPVAPPAAKPVAPPAAEPVAPPAAEPVAPPAAEPVAPPAAEPVAPPAAEPVAPPAAEVNNAAVLEAKRLERNAKAKAKRDEKKVVEASKVVSKPSPLPEWAEELEAEPVSSETGEEEEEPRKVARFEFKGTKYLKDEENNIYIPETEEHIGTFDEVNQCIDYCEEEEEEEE